MLVNKLQAKMANELGKKYNMRLVGDSAAMPEGIISELGLLFRISRLLTREEARVILIDCVQTFLSEINSNENLKPYLKNRPFTSRNISITIFIKNQDGQDVSDPNLGVIHARFGKLDYITYQKESKYYEHQCESEESFEEALSLVNQSNPSKKISINEHDYYSN